MLKLYSVGIAWSFWAPYVAHLAKHHPTWWFEGEARYKLGGVLDEPGGDA